MTFTILTLPSYDASILDWPATCAGIRCSATIAIPTAAEIIARSREKLAVLGPVLERHNDDVFEPVIELLKAAADDADVVAVKMTVYRTGTDSVLMESLFKLTELESRIPLNMNVLVKGRIPKVVGLAEALREWLDHRREVLLRRSHHRLAPHDHPDGRPDRDAQGPRRRDPLGQIGRAHV